MRASTSKKGTTGWHRGAERARAQAVALLKRIGPSVDTLTEAELRKMHRQLAADLKRLVREIDKHLAEAPAKTASAATRSRGRPL